MQADRVGANVSIPLGDCALFRARRVGTGSVIWT